MTTISDYLTGGNADTTDASTPSQPFMDLSAAPSYMVAANSHNYGNVNTTWDQSEDDSSNPITSAGKFAAVSIASGVNSFYNTAIWAGNWFSDDGAQYRDTKDWISSFDDDLGKYYEGHKESADLVGFALSSFVPGLGGVKVLSAGAKILGAAREGSFGFNIARATGLVPGVRDGLVKAAVTDIVEGNTGITLLNGNAIKGIASGFAEQTLQALAFETAATVALKKSPILDDLDFKDTVANITMGGLVGGAIGGVLGGAVTYRQIKKGVVAVDKELKPYTYEQEVAPGTAPSDALLTYKNDLVNTPSAPSENAAATQAATVKARNIDNKMRTATNELAGGDYEVGNFLHDASKYSSQEQYEANFFKLDSVERVNKPEPFYGKDPLPEEVLTQPKYMRLWGENAGMISDDAPPVLSLADTVPKGSDIQVSAKGVRAGNKFYEHAVGDGTDFATITDPLVAESRYVQALEGRSFQEIFDAQKGIKAGQPISIDHQDIAYLEKAYNEGFSNYNLKLPDGGIVEGLPPKQLLGYIKDVKETVAAKHLDNVSQSVNAENAAKLEKYQAARDKADEGPAINSSSIKEPTLSSDVASTEAIARITNTKLAYLEGTAQSDDITKDIFALQTAKQDIIDRAANAGNTLDPDTVHPWLVPQHVRLNYATKDVSDINGNVLEGMVAIQQKQAMLRGTQDNAALTVLGDEAHSLLPDVRTRDILNTTRVGAGSGFTSFADGAYGSPESLMQQIGSVTIGKIRSAQAATAEAFTGVNYAVVNKPEVAAELAAINTKARSTGMEYVMSEDGNSLQLKFVRNYYRALEAGEEATMPDIPNGVLENIPFRSPEAKDWIQTHIGINGARSVGKNNINGARSIPGVRDPEVFYGVPPSADKKFIAFVVDPTITGTGHTSMIYANDAEQLNHLIAKASEIDGLTVVTKNDVEAYKAALGEYKYSEGLNQNYIDSALARTGKGANFFPPTDPQQFIKEAMDWHSQQDAMLVRDAISTKYAVQFQELRDLGSRFTDTQTSTLGSGGFGKYAEDAIKNPYASYVKTALGIGNQSDYPLWTSLNKGVDQAGNAVFSSVVKIFRQSKSLEDLGEINNIMDSYGVNTAYQSAATNLWANHPAGTAAVTDFIRKSNSIMSTLVLRMDPMNALNNSLGATVLRGAETASVVRAIRAGNSDAVGALAGLMNIGVPGVSDTIMSPTKLIAGAIGDLFSDGLNGPLMSKYRQMGLVKGQTAQFNEMLDTLAIKGTETPAEFATKGQQAYAMLGKIAEGAEKWTGNKLAEDTNRFLSARIMDKLTGIAVDNGLMDAKTANSYINTFVNRVEGNTLAAQRPMMFQGPVGQAIGLFQTYQFNIMQNLLRHVGEGSAKDAATLLGLQGTIYGMNGLPAFGAINNHIIGTASGNTNHTDAYTSINNLVGKTAGDWLTYGLASNFLIHPDLKLNLYTRGDINPRSLTVVPTQLSDIPIVSGFTKFFGNLKDTVSKIENGGDVWGSLLQGIEHNGVNRPLAGLAQVLESAANPNSQSYSTSNKGNIVASNDFLSLANFARITGAKPLDEAVALDGAFRVQAYAAVDAARKNALGAAIKTSVIEGKAPSNDQMDGFAEDYAKIGGKQDEFNKFYMRQFKNANTSQANTIANNLKTPYGQYMQNIMGGRSFKVSPSQNPVPTGFDPTTSEE